MPQATENAAELLAQILDPANRANPYPLYARLRETRSPRWRTASWPSAATPISPPYCTTRA
jgi:hypothetical protein